jgi:hypothetical protein
MVEDNGKKLRWESMVDGLHTLILNRTKKPLVIVLRERGRD